MYRYYLRFMHKIHTIKHYMLLNSVCKFEINLFSTKPKIRLKKRPTVIGRAFFCCWILIMAGSVLQICDGREIEAQMFQFSTNIY
jgi:hypothetical protein